MGKEELTEFVNRELYPRIIHKVKEIFPSMSFELVREEWHSPFNIDGTKPKRSRKDKTVIPLNKKSGQVKYYAIENGNGGEKDLVTLYQELNGVTAIDAIKAIASICGLELPPSPDDERYRKARERSEFMEGSLSRQREALFSEEGKRVLEYLTKERGYSRTLIEKMGLGYLSPAEGNALRENGVSLPSDFTGFPLSIPYISGSKVLGFKLRSIAGSGTGKYRNTVNLNGVMNKSPFLLDIPRNKEGIVVIVEGELDALHAKAEGLTDVIATSGSAITSEAVEALRGNGYKRAILLLDDDEAGKGFTIRSIANLERGGVVPYTCELQGEKDIDEYLSSHTGEELKSLIKRGTIPSSLYLCEKEVERYSRTDEGVIEQDKLFANLADIYRSARDEVEKSRISAFLDGCFNEFPGIGKIIATKAERAKNNNENEALKAKARKELSEAIPLVSGDLSQATEKARKALDTLRKVEDGEKYSFVVKDDTEELWESYKSLPKTLKTRFELVHGTGKNEEIYTLSFPSGGISIIGAPTNHGKSKLMQSLAIDALTDEEEEGVILYFTYEENRENVNIQFLNAFANVELTKKTERHGNIQTIKEYLFDGSTRFIRDSEVNGFIEKEKEWKGILHSQRIKLIKPEDNYLRTLLGILRYAVDNIKVRSVFIDYVQELYIENYRYSGGRVDELKEIMVSLDLFAQSANIPVIISSQLARTVDSPLDLCNQCLSDSGWIERKASEIVLMWSSKETPKNDPTGAKMTRIKEKNSPTAFFKIGEDGELFLKLTKSRTIPTNSTAIVNINGNTGRVYPKERKQKIKIEEPKFDFSSNAPFSRRNKEDEELPF